MSCEIESFYVKTYNDALIPIYGVSSFVLAESRDFQIVFSNDPNSEKLISIGSSSSRSIFHIMKDISVYEDDKKGLPEFDLNLCVLIAELTVNNFLRPRNFKMEVTKLTFSENFYVKAVNLHNERN